MRPGSRAGFRDHRRARIRAARPYAVSEWPHTREPEPTPAPKRATGPATQTLSPETQAKWDQWANRRIDAALARLVKNLEKDISVVLADCLAELRRDIEREYKAELSWLRQDVVRLTLRISQLEGRPIEATTVNGQAEHGLQ